MRQRAVCLGVLVLVSAALLAAQPAVGNVTLEGAVVNAVTGEPLAGARVKVNVGRGREPLYLRTDADGRFLARDLPAGYYGLDVNSPGFSSGSSLSLDVRTTGTATIPLVRAAGAKLSRYLDKGGVLHAEVFLPLTPYAVITGRVTDPEGFPVEDCWVEVLRRRSASQAEVVQVTMLHTDDRGEFRGSHLGPGTYYVAANRPGPWSEWESSFRITYYPRALDVASAKPLELAAGQQARADIQILRRAGVRVAGRLLQPGGEASANRRLMTKVFLRPEQSDLINSNGPFTTGTNSYELKNVLPGRYRAIALTYDVASEPFPGNHQVLFGVSRPVEVGEHDMEDVDLALEPTHDLPGVVRFRGRCPPCPVRVSASAVRSFAGQAAALSDTEGRFVLPHLPPGRFRLSVTLPGMQPLFIVSAHLGNRDVLKDAIEVPFAGDESLYVEVDCAPGVVRR